MCNDYRLMVDVASIVEDFARRSTGRSRKGRHCGPDPTYLAKLDVEATFVN